MGCATSISNPKPSNNNDCGCPASAADDRDPGVAAAATGGLLNTWDDDPYATREIVLSDQQKKIIVKNWKQLCIDLTGRGARIFQLIFARNPRVRALFSCGHLQGEELIKDARFRGHASRFMQV